MMDRSLPEENNQEEERYEVLHQLEEWLEVPVIVLGFVWLVLLVIELIWGLNPLLNTFVWIIWGIFVLEFALRLTLAPRKVVFLRSNWLTVLSLVLPALRIFRIAWLIRFTRLARTTRSLRLVRVISSVNRGMNALRTTLQRRGFVYVILLTVVVILVGSAGMFAFESVLPEGEGIGNFGDALWFTAMIMTTLGSEYWPKTTEGRILSFLLSIYALAVFGYVTATLATYFIGREAESSESDIVSERAIEGLRAEIRALRAELQNNTGNELES